MGGFPHGAHRVGKNANSTPPPCQNNRAEFSEKQWEAIPWGDTVPAQIQDPEGVPNTNVTLALLHPPSTAWPGDSCPEVTLK